jgi:hypothetical protein
MKHFKKILYKYWILIGIVCLGAFLGLYQLDTLPGEMWGDATAHYALAQGVIHGKYFFNYQFGGDGPIFTYLVVAVSWLLGLSFYTLKFTSVLVYLSFIVTMYFLTDELFKKKEITYISTFLTAISFWSITFARQPHARMLVPLFISLTMLAAVRKKTILSGILLGLGMYSQASFWAMPFVFWRRYKILSIGFLLTIPLAVMFATGGIGFFTNSSYFGEKLATSDNLSLSQIVQNIEHNISANFFSFTSKGDTGFRLNVPSSPQLDTASALFFFIGYLLLVIKSLKEKNMKYIEFLILPFLIIQIPSLLDIHNPYAQPNIGRMIGVIPFVYITTAYGLTATWHAATNIEFKSKKTKSIVYYFCVGYLLLIITLANIYKYFIVYPNYLPNKNTPFDRIIEKYIDDSASQTSFVIIGSGWGQWGQPEKQAIIDDTTTSHTINFLQPPVQPETFCTYMDTTHNLVFITSPTDTTSLSSIATCKKRLVSFTMQSNSFQVANVIEIK